MLLAKYPVALPLLLDTIREQHMNPILSWLTVITPPLGVATIGECTSRIEWRHAIRAAQLFGAMRDGHDPIR